MIDRRPLGITVTVSYRNGGVVVKLLWLAVRNAEKKWTYPIRHWRALHQFAIYFPGRVPVAI